MNRIIIIALALFAILPVAAKKEKKVENPDTLIFTTVLKNPVTSIKDQNNSGTCWSYSSLAFLESEVLKKHPEMTDIDLCESFVVSKTYIDRADRNIRTHGDASFSEGGSFYDVIYCMEHNGLIPEGIMPYPNLPYGDSLFNFKCFFDPMAAYVKNISGSELKKIKPAWRTAVQGMLDAYFGTCPEEFEYKGVKYTPKSFVKDYLTLDPSDYVSLTSYTHHPFYSTFVLEIQDNWRWASSYNLPLDEFVRVMEESVKNGWTFAWGADVSEEGFARRTSKNKCVAMVPIPSDNVKKVGSDQCRWTGEKAQISESDSKGELTITQDMRQAAYDNWETTDDHGMQIYGIATDQHGKEYFMMKNSWGDYGPYEGFWYVSKPYVAYKTMNIVINKNAIPADIRAKLGI